MKVGEYIRTKDGIIDKVVIEYNGKCASPTCNCKHVSCEKNYYNEDEIIKSSPNIIDLIEVGDYVNGLPVCETTNNEIYVGVKDSTFYWFVSDIDSVVTKEQFSQMEYRIGE